MSAWYKTGTATATNGSTAVTGATTAWTANAFVGDGIRFGTETVIYEIAAVGGNTALTLATAYAGTTGSGKSYVIIPMSTARKQVSNLMASVGTLLSTLALGAANLFGITKANSAASAAVQFVSGGVAVGRVGQVGSNALTVSTSTDGSTWRDGISVNATTGVASFPNGVALFGFENGSAAAPSLAFTSDTDTGVYRIAADTVGVATGGVERMRISSNGRVGIGGVPSTALHVFAGGIYADMEDGTGMRMTSSNATTAGTAPGVIQRRSRGTLASPSATLSGDRLGAHFWHGYGATVWQSPSAQILVDAAENFTDSVAGARMRFFTTLPGAGTNTERARFEGANFGIGTTAPTAMLHVAGAIRMASVTVANLASTYPPGTVGAGSLVYVSNASGGAIVAFCDGTNWRRLDDRTVVS